MKKGIKKCLEGLGAGVLLIKIIVCRTHDGRRTRGAEMAAVGLRPRSLIAALTALTLALAWLPVANAAVGLDESLEAKLGLPMVGTHTSLKKKLERKNKTNSNCTLPTLPLGRRKKWIWNFPAPSPPAPPLARAAGDRPFSHKTLAPLKRDPF